MESLFLGLSSSLAFGVLDILLASASRALSSLRALAFAQAASVGLLLLWSPGMPFWQHPLELVPPLLLVGGGLGVINALATISLYRALAAGPMAVVSPLSSGYGLVTVLLSVCVLHQTLSAGQSVMLLLIMGGMITMILAGKKNGASVLARGPLSLCTPGVFYGLVSMLGFGLEFFLQSLVTTHYGAWQPLLWSRLCSMLLLFIMARKCQDVQTKGHLDVRQAGMIALIGLFDTCGMLCYSLGTSQGNTSMIAALSSTYPLLPMLVGALLYRERLRRRQWLGIALLLLGIVGLSYTGLSQTEGKERGQPMATAISFSHPIGGERLLTTLQHNQLSHLLIHTFGGCLPSPPSDLLSVRRVLDLGCGSGAWATEYARAHPYQQVLGLDIHRVAVKRATHQHLSNLRYGRISTFAGPFALPEASHDLIHLQNVDVDQHCWPKLLAECWRLLRPGGTLCLLAWEEPLTNASAWEAIAGATLRAKARAGYSFPFCGEPLRRERHQGLLCELEPLCTSAGFRCRMQVQAINASFGVPDSTEWQHALLLSPATRRLIIETGVASEEEIDALSRQQQEEMRLPLFHAFLPILVLWGTKPG